MPTSPATPQGVPTSPATPQGVPTSPATPQGVPTSPATPQGVPLVGVVALQGAAAEHVAVLRSLGAGAIEVRTPADLDGVDAVVLPGGESTTMSHLLRTSGLFDALEQRLAAGMPAFGTCAGMILLATEVLDGRRISVPSVPSTSQCAETPSAAR